MIKKQTIWLLTMLSLLVVLTIYYVTSDKDNFAFTFVPDKAANVDEPVDDPIEIGITSQDDIGEYEFFLMTRMEIEDQRSMKKERLKEVIKANNVSATEVNNALDEIDYLENISIKENVARQSILSLDDAYSDVLVRTDEDKVMVHVLTDDMLPEAASHIIQVVRDEIGMNEVEVNFQPMDEK